jgi:hypothetical protein
MTPRPIRVLSNRLRRIATVMLIFFLLVYCGIRAYTTNIAHRTLSLLAEISRISLGASEDSVLPIVSRYGGVRRPSPAPDPTNDCPDKAVCEDRNARIPDYFYEIQLSPFDVFSALHQRPTGIHLALAALMFRVPSLCRDPLSLRDWVGNVEIGIRGGRVDSVVGALYVEGRTRWLGNSWQLSADMPNPDMRQKSYAIDGTFLEFPGYGGAGTLYYFTPAATHEQVLVAQTINKRCLTGITPCRCLWDLSPLVFQYLRRHPDAGSTIITPDDCPDPNAPQSDS